MSRAALRRDLGTWDAFTVVVTTTIGTGIFTTPHLVARHTDRSSWHLLLWGLGGLYAFLGGLLYAELGTRVPTSGGEYRYLLKSWGRFVAFLFGWKGFVIAGPSSRAGLALIATFYLGHLVPLDGRDELVVATAFLIALGAVTYLGNRPSLLIQKTSLVVKVAALFLLVVAGFATWRTSAAAPASGTDAAALTSGAADLTRKMLLIFFTYIGWEAVGYVAGELRDPRRALPRAILGGVIVVTALYVLLVALFEHVLGPALRTDPAPAARVAERLIGDSGGRLVAALIVVSALGSMAASLMATSRVFWAMARDGLFFRGLGHVHPVFGTPSRSIAAHTAACVALLWLRQNLETILVGMITTRLLFTALSVLGLVVLRRRDDAASGGRAIYRAPFGDALPILFAGSILALLAVRTVADPRAALIDLAFVASGVPVAFWWLRRPEADGDRSEREASA